MTADIQVNASKISCPVISGTFPRTRLFNVLDGYQNIPVIWVSSPPGAGKTTLVSNYLEHNNRSTIWYQIDTGDEDISTFFYYLGLAAKKASPRKRKSLPLLTPEYQEGLETFCRNFFRDLFARFNKPVALVLDNYHEICTASDLHRLLTVGLQEIPVHGQVIIISRTDPLPEFIRMRANSRLVLMDWSDLKMNQEEMRNILSIKGNKHHSIEKIMQITQGWMAGLILLLEQKREDFTLDENNSEFNPALLFDYFGGEVFTNTSQACQQFLVKTALFPKMTLDMASQLTGLKQGKSSEILDFVLDKNFFTYQHRTKPPLYEYHPLFRDFLLEKINKEMSGVEQTVLKWRAAELLQENNQVEAAVELLIEVKDWQTLSVIIKQIAPTMLEQGRHQTLQEWILFIPGAVRESDPWLLCWLGECYKDYTPGESWPHYEKAFKIFEQQQDITGLYFSLAGIIDGIRLQHDAELTRLDPWLDRFDRLRKSHPFPSNEVEARVGTVVFTALWWYRPDHPDLEYWRERVLEIAPGISGGMKYVITVNVAYAFCLVFSGQPKEAQYLIYQVKQVDKDMIPVLVRTWINLCSALYYWRCGEYAACKEEVDQGLLISHQAGTHVEDYQLLAVGVSFCLNCENKSLADHYLQLLKPFEHGIKGSRYYYIHAWYEYIYGDLDQAEQFAQIAVKLADETGAPFFRGLAYQVLGVILHTQGKLEAAYLILEKFQQLLQTAYNSKLLWYCIENTRALFAIREGKDEQVQEALQSAFSMARECGYIGTSAFSKKDISLLCAHALQRDIEVDHVWKTIRTMQLQPDPAFIHLQNWPWEIEIYGFAYCEIKKQGEPVKFSRKTPRKVTQLIGVLVSQGGQEVPEDRIIEFLWPDSEGDAGIQALNTTLHRTRKIIGNDAITVNDGRLSFNPQRVWSDVNTFEHILKVVQTLPVQNKADRKRLIERALSLYRGHFLGDSSAAWVIPARERLRNKFLNTLETYGQLLERDKDWDNAIAWYKKGLEIDMLAEQFYQRLMYCYEQLGRYAEAVEVYRQCYRIMTSSLGVEPSEATKSIYHAVRAA